MQFGNIMKGPGDEEESVEFEIEQDESVRDYLDEIYDDDYNSNDSYGYDYDYSWYDYGYE